ncbi:hypothetical protein IQ254_12725 [Nodosilinea sp. LEGE 07088]|uniref:hypothetical protein n=1 Tax=Nodosilinea sp. LEGE 07088 TaxID=2777968 RepID=UPI0018830197|nr:hypothetical protein [Nodosilinea sp. LEGE 07088]MBE9138043.1 hypothetical protein [Nodosilinea sp. LEGE 07088]
MTEPLADVVSEGSLQVGALLNAFSAKLSAFDGGGLLVFKREKRHGFQRVGDLTRNWDGDFSAD